MKKRRLLFQMGKNYSYTLLGSPDIAGVNEMLARNQNTLVLLHEPDVAKQLESTNHALVLAGHSHGGQVYLPFIGPLATTALAEEYVKGWYTLSGNVNPNLYVILTWKYKTAISF